MLAFNNLYIINGLLGKGGFGSVFAGRRRSDGHEVAVKFVQDGNVPEWHTVCTNCCFFCVLASITLCVSFVGG